jgi:hypothetical protein
MEFLIFAPTEQLLGSIGSEVTDRTPSSVTWLQEKGGSRQELHPTACSSVSETHEGLPVRLQSSCLNLVRGYGPLSIFDNY